MKEITVELLCEMTDDELRDRGAELSAASIEYDKIEDDKKSAMKEFKEELEELRQKRRRLSFNIRRKAEVRLVNCIVEFHSPVSGTKRITRFDTGEYVRDEPMTAEEHQNNLFEEKSAKKEQVQ
jgi:hypothetical protein